MTNVKLKLMFFILNSILLQDVHARPYEDTNSTDVVITFFTNSTFTLPVDSNSDTLIVATDEETAEINKNSNTQLEAIVEAEQDRDEALSKKNIKEQNKVLSIPQEDAKSFEKQLNISSPTLEQIIDAETGREEDLTDILFKSDSEFVEDVPRFEFLIARKINESEISDKSLDGKDRYSENNLEKENRNSSDLLKKLEYVELVELLKSGRKEENKSAYNLANITGYEVEDDLAPDTRFTDLQTLVLACLGTLLPLLGVLFATLFIRCLIRRYCPGCCKKYSISTASSSSDKQENQQLKSSTDDASPGGDGVDSDGLPANGSIITMTLKNNHLIVETEERNDITRNGRETKMKYSPDNDGIFVVEVQQSAAYRSNNKSLQNSPPHDPQISTNQALIHRVPEELENKIIEEDSERSSGKFESQRALALSSTGLSISDLSMSSIGSHNLSYTYGNQMGYEQGPFGYPIYAGYDIPKEDSGNNIIHENSTEPLISKTPTDHVKPVVTAAIFKQDSIIGNEALQGPGYSIEGSTDGPLLSDIQAREISLQHIHDEVEKKLGNGVAVHIPETIDTSKKTLTRADSLPMQLQNNKVPDKIIDKADVMNMIMEDNVPSKESLKGKRASLPIIRTEIYESVKDAIRPTGSPKFEKFNNDISPGEGSMENAPPMITITEEIEPQRVDDDS